MVSFVFTEKSPSQEVVFILHPLCFGIRGVWLGMVFADLLLAPALPWQVCWRHRGEIYQPYTNDEPTESVDSSTGNGFCPRNATVLQIACKALAMFDFEAKLKACIKHA